MRSQPPAHAHEVVTRVCDQALRRVRKQLAIAFDGDPRSAVAAPHVFEKLAVPGICVK